MRRHVQLIELFLGRYKDAGGRPYRLAERPDQIERAKKAIDVIAVDDRGNRLAIEHTLVEPFQGQKADDQPFLAAFGGLHHSPDLTVPNRLIDLLVPVGAIPKGVDWRAVAERVYEWFRESRLNIPAGDSEHTIPNLDFELTVHIESTDIQETPGVLVVGRILPRDRPFSDMLRKALASKLPKLVAASAQNRILLIEDASTILGLTVFSNEIDPAATFQTWRKSIRFGWLIRRSGRAIRSLGFFMCGLMGFKNASPSLSSGNSSPCPVSDRLVPKRLS